MTVFILRFRAQNFNFLIRMGVSYLSKPMTEKISSDENSSRLSFGASSMQGWREYQEDAHNCIIDFDKNTSFFAIYDGHGGGEVARYCTLHLPDFFRSLVNYKSGNISQALEDAFLELDKSLITQEVLDELKVLTTDTKLCSTPGENSGCTAVVAVVEGNQLYVANAGDSRCVVSRDSKAVDMSIDHKPENETERERIYKAGGTVTDGRVDGNLNLSRAIGDHQYKKNELLNAQEQIVSAQPDVQTLTIDPSMDAFMILACDGIWECMSSQEVVDFVDGQLKSGEEKLSAICEKLFDHCLAPEEEFFKEAKGMDNMTCIIVRFHDLPTSKRGKPPLQPASDDRETKKPKKKKVKGQKRRHRDKGGISSSTPKK